MLTVECRVNGQIIGFTNVINICDEGMHQAAMIAQNEDHVCMYRFEHRPAGLDTVCSGTVKHSRNDRFEELVRIVFAAIREKVKEE